MATYEDLANASEENREEISDEELLNIGLRVASAHLEKLGHGLLGFERLADGDKGVRFMQGGDEALCFVVVARYPRPPEIAAIQPHPIVPESTKQFVLGITFAHELDAFDPEDTVGMKLMRGFRVLPKIYDLLPIQG